MKRSVTQKAAALAGSTAALAAASPSVNAAVTLAKNGIGTTIPNDTTSFNWDVDADGNHDFRLDSGFGGVYVYLDSAGLNGSGVLQRAGAVNVGEVANLGTAPIAIGQTVAGYQWGTAERRIVTVDDPGNDFWNGVQGDQNFIGFRFESNDGTHYGWAQLEIGSLTIVNAAYESDPDTAITLGAVPEPSNLALLGLGIAGLSMMRRRKSA